MEKDWVKLKDLDPSYMKEVKVFTLQDLSELTEQKVNEILEEDVVVLRNFETTCKIDSDKFSSDNLAKFYGDTIVDVVTQDATAQFMDRSPKSEQFKS